MAVPSEDYRRRRPEADVLYGVVRGHFEIFCVHASRWRDGAGLPAFIEREFEAYLRCGVLAGGFALNVHLHALVLDGVYAKDAAGRLRFHETPPMATLDVVEVLAAIEARLARLLTRRDAAGTDDEDQWMIEAPAMATLASASVLGTGGAASGRGRGGGEPIDDDEMASGRCLARSAGFICMRASWCRPVRANGSSRCAAMSCGRRCRPSGCIWPPMAGLLSPCGTRGRMAGRPSRSAR